MLKLTTQFLPHQPSSHAQEPPWLVAPTQDSTDTHCLLLTGSSCTALLSDVPDVFTAGSFLSSPPDLHNPTETGCTGGAGGHGSCTTGRDRLSYSLWSPLSPGRLLFLSPPQTVSKNRTFRTCSLQTLQHRTMPGQNGCSECGDLMTRKLRQGRNHSFKKGTKLNVML